MKQQELTQLLKKEMIPALGCTGPTAYALATACCRPYISGEVERIQVYVSPAFLKIGFGVATPGTSRPGIEIAAALGLVGGDYKLGLQVLSTATQADMEQAEKLVDNGMIEVLCAWDKEGVYVRAEVTTQKEQVLAIVEHTHDGVSLIRVNGIDVFRAQTQGEQLEDDPGQLSLNDIFSYINQVPISDIQFLLDGFQMNMDLAQAALKEPFGLACGRAFLKEYWADRAIPPDLFQRPLEYLPDSIPDRAKILVAAASDGRMGGCRLPAMAAMGDGNQGLTAMIPVGVAGQMLGAEQERICRALALSCLMLFYVKMNIGRASAFCLCAIAASAGVAAGYGYLRGFKNEQIEAAVKNVISPLAGMLCDGAKNGCALKMAIATTTAFTAAGLAEDGVQMGYYDGVCDDSLADTVTCITQVATKTMELLDRCMVDEILAKTRRRVEQKA